MHPLPPCFYWCEHPHICLSVPSFYLHWSINCWQLFDKTSQIRQSIQGFSTLISRENSLFMVHCSQHDCHCATSSIQEEQRGCVSWVRSVFWKNRGKLPSSRCPLLFCLLESPRMWFARQSPLSRACLYWWRKNTHPLMYLQCTFGADHTTEKCLPIGITLTLLQGSHTVATLLDIYCVFKSSKVILFP